MSVYQQDDANADADDDASYMYERMMGWDRNLRKCTICIRRGGRIDA
jgi:hypothetical protein